MRIIFVVDNQWPSQAVRILSFIVRMIPVSTRLVNLPKILAFCLTGDGRGCIINNFCTHFEVVHYALTRTNWTLCCLYWAVHMCSAVLEKSVEMKACIFIAETVGHVYYDTVTLIHFNHWNWPFAIDSNCWSVELAIWVSGGPGNVPVIGHRFCKNR